MKAVFKSAGMERKMKTEVVIFDFDGTIGDTAKTIVAAKQETMRIAGLVVADETTCLSTIGLSCRAGFLSVYPDLPEAKLDLCVSEYKTVFEEMKRKIPPTCFEGVERVLAVLKEQKIKSTIATSRGQDSLKTFLEEWGIDGYFPYVLGAEGTELLKPNPDPVLKTLKDLQIDPKQALVVGDMPVDIEMGKAAGVYTCGVTYGNASRESLKAAGADFIIDRIEELLDIVG